MHKNLYVCYEFLLKFYDSKYFLNDDWMICMENRMHAAIAMLVLKVLNVKGGE